MEIKIVKGYGPNRDNKEAQTEFLLLLKNFLSEAGLAVSSISSENDLGGSIAIEIPDNTRLRDVIYSFQSIAEVLSKGEGKIAFDVELPCFSEPITVIG